MRNLIWIAIFSTTMWIVGDVNAQPPKQRKGGQSQEGGFGNGQRGAGQRGRRGGGNTMEFLFKRFDQNQDGKISASEAPDRMKQRFDTIDTDGDQAVSRQELEAAFAKAGQNGGRGQGKGQGKKGGGKGAGGKGNGNRSQIDPAALHKRMDNNGDGVIDQNEAPGRMKNRFGQIDADGSGTISVEELTSALEKMQKSGGKKGGKKGGQIGRNKSSSPDATLPVKPKRPPFDEGA